MNALCKLSFEIPSSQLVGCWFRKKIFKNIQTGHFWLDKQTTSNSWEDFFWTVLHLWSLGGWSHAHPCESSVMISPRHLVWVHLTDTSQSETAIAVTLVRLEVIPFPYAWTDTPQLLQPLDAGRTETSRRFWCRWSGRAPSAISRIVSLNRWIHEKCRFGDTHYKRHVKYAHKQKPRRACTFIFMMAQSQSLLSVYTDVYRHNPPPCCF